MRCGCRSLADASLAVLWGMAHHRTADLDPAVPPTSLAPAHGLFAENAADLPGEALKKPPYLGAGSARSFELGVGIDIAPLTDEVLVHRSQS